MIVESPIGNLEVHATYCGLESVQFIDPSVESPGDKPHSLERRTAELLNQYFDGSHCSPFNQEIPLYLKGTAFQVMVWNALLKIPYGEQVSYKEFAASLGRADAVRAVGTAIGMNPLPVVIPCHRVIGSDGRLHGYLAGTEVKRWLLQHEQGSRIPVLSA